MFEKLAALFSQTDVPLSPHATAERAAGAVAEIEQELATAQAKAEALRQDYDAGLLRSLVDGNEPRNLKARRTLADAEDRVTEYRKALDLARGSLATATSAAAAADLAAAWENFDAIDRLRIEATAEEQDAIKALARKHERVIVLTARLVQALPVKLRDDVRYSLSTDYFNAAVRTFLAGQSSGLLARLNLSLCDTQALPDLVAQAKGASRAINLSRVPAVEGDDDDRAA